MRQEADEKAARRMLRISSVAARGYIIGIRRRLSRRPMIKATPMTLAAGDKIPDVTFTKMGANGPEPIAASAYFAGRKVALFSVPGAFTPTCSKTHLPGFVEQADAIKAKGVDAIAVTAVNDIFALDAWLVGASAKGKVDGLADGSATFVKAAGVELDLIAFGLGLRGKRFAALVTNGVIDWIEIEENSSACTVSSAQELLAKL
jgi:glutaredoxin/glutathione-dependent peroxiredoxin